jgi:sugar (pentulose or hexulose) kinase
MMRYLAVDLGSSFVKGSVLDLDTLALRQIERFPFPEPIAGLDPAFREFDPEAVLAVVRALLERLLRHAPDAEGVVLCSQLHSLVLVAEDGRPRSNAITWQDQRALSPMPDGAGTYFDEIFRRVTIEERRELGNQPRPGVPLCFLFWLAQNRALPHPPALAVTLPSYVVSSLCGCPPKLEITHAFASGAFNVVTRDWHRAVIAKLGLQDVRWPDLVPQGTRLGEARVGPRRLPCFTPVGDFQCSQVAAFLDEGELSINISTGSAVIQLSRGLEFGEFETRPFFDGRFVRTITHIPGGRALNALIGLLVELAGAQGVQLRDPWEYILAESARTGTTDLRVNPAFYFSAMGDRGAITNAREENLTVGHLFRAAFNGMADNYARCAQRLSPARDWRQLVFSGGVALKIPLLRQLICDRLGLESRLVASEEDTLLGLLVLALAFSGRAASVADAMAFARQHCPISSP